MALIAWIVIVAAAAFLQLSEQTTLADIRLQRLQPLPIPTSIRPPSEPPKVRMLSYSPLIMYMENFVSLEEREYILQLGNPNLERSKALSSNGTSFIFDGRTSSTAYLPRTDHVVTSIARRAAEFQGYQPRYNVDLQVTHYQQGQQYTPHYDWHPRHRLVTTAYGDRMQRLSTFFVILEADCAKCGTQFTQLSADWSMRDRRWCQVIDCEEKVVTTKPNPGSAVFWVNLDENGQGRLDVMHAGLPVMNGTKTGLNIWTYIDIPEDDEEEK